MTAARRNLVISPIGGESVHRSWLDRPAERSFDLCLLHYGRETGFGKADADFPQFVDVVKGFLGVP